MDYLSFIKTYLINIPEIQRAYVQGADANAQKRDDFIDAIFDSLKNPKSPLQLDFIYGTSKQSGKHNLFFPVDGQQRLTTLSLIGWILSRRAFSKEEREKMSIPSLSIEYKVCSSSEQFVKDLFNNFDVPDGFKWHDREKPRVLSEYIRKTPSWYVEQWDEDKTIIAMLNMLDALNNKLNSCTQDEILTLASNFFECTCVEFESLDMQNYSLTEDLYIKMNARGKHLTRFENWKAEFYGFLKDRYGNAKASEFSGKIEHEWCDLFWKYAIYEWQKDGEPRDVYPRIDEFFMRVFDFITSILFHSQINIVNRSEELKIDRAQVYLMDQRKNEFEVYEKPENVEMLFSILDKIVYLENQHESVDKWLSGFLTGKFDKKDPVRINIFENTDLFDRLVRGKEVSLPLRMLLYSILLRIVKYPSASIEEMSDFTRVMWGWLLSRSQRLAALLDVRFDFNLEHIAIAHKVIDELQTNQDALLAVSSSKLAQLDKEREKVELLKTNKYDAIRVLCNHPYLKGDFSNIYNALSSTTAQDIIDRFLVFADMPSDQERVKELIRYGAKGAHPWSDYCFYGLEGHWSYVFSTPTDTSVNKAITNYLTQGNQIVYSSNEMEYYILKYQEFLQSTEKNYFYKKDKFTVWALKRISSRPLNGYNSCPYAATVVSKCDKHIKVSLKLEQYSWYSDHGFLKSDILGLKMECVEKGWIVSISENADSDISNRLQILQAFINGYNGVTTYETIENGSEDDVLKFLLSDTNNNDRIQTALKFLKTLYEGCSSSLKL